MLQSFTGVLENGQILCEESKQLPKHAKVVVTVLEEIDVPKVQGTLSKYIGIWANSPQDKKDFVPFVPLLVFFYQQRL